MAVVKHDAGMQRAQPLDLVSKRGVVGREIKPLAALDLLRRRRAALAIEPTTIEGFGREKARGRLPGVERRAGGIAVDVDHRARKRGVHGRSTELAGEGVELLDVPVGVVAGERKRYQGRRALRRNAQAGVWKRQQERCVAP
jgi:hypothetical protein